MAITLEKSEWATESAETPKPVLNKQTFASFITNKVVKGVTWDKDTNIGWMAIDFTDGSRVVITGGNFTYVRYVTPPRK